MGVEYRHIGCMAAFGALALASGMVDVRPAMAQMDVQPSWGEQGEQTSTEESVEQPMGWSRTLEPVDIRSLNRPLTELERLSQSQSGAGFFIRSFYDVSEDSPLEPVSVTIRALDKTTAQFTDIEINIGALATFGTLTILPRVCDKNPPEEFPEISAFLEISSAQNDAFLAKNADWKLTNSSQSAHRSTESAMDRNDHKVFTAENALERIAPQSITQTFDQIEGKPTNHGETSWNVVPKNTVQEMSFAKLPVVFKGWMFASSPALNALEHPVYDVWVIDCKMMDPAL